MTDQLKMFDQTTCEDSHSAISSPASADGPMLCDSPDGQTSEPCGQEVAPVSHSRSLVLNKVSMTRGTCGQTGSDLSPSAVLQLSLENKLRAQLTGSISCEVIFKKWITPWGQSLWKPRARVRSISGIGIGLWPTMTSNAPAKGYNEAGNSAGQVAIRKIMLALWPTCRANESTGSKIPPGRQGGIALKSAVSLTSNVTMENGAGSLHPEFAGWAMGYPPEWLNCAPSETRSIRGAQRNSSKRMSKQPDTDSEKQ